MRSLGSVWANAQNKHSAPGICTLSPVSFFKAVPRHRGPRLSATVPRNLHKYHPIHFPRRPTHPDLGWTHAGRQDGCASAVKHERLGGGALRREGCSYGSCWCELSCLAHVDRDSRRVG